LDTPRDGAMRCDAFREQLQMIGWLGALLPILFWIGLYVIGSGLELQSFPTLRAPGKASRRVALKQLGLEGSGSVNNSQYSSYCSIASKILFSYNIVGLIEYGFEDTLYPGLSKKGLNISHHIKSPKHVFLRHSPTQLFQYYTIQLNSILS